MEEKGLRWGEEKLETNIFGVPTYRKPGTMPDTSQVVFLDYPKTCERSMVIYLLQIRRLRLTKVKELPAYMCQNQDQIQVPIELHTCLACSRAGERVGPVHLPRLGAMSRLKDILSFQECQVTGQRARLVMSFSGRGQGVCLQCQRACGQRAGLPGGATVSHAVVGAVRNRGGPNSRGSCRT